MTKLPTEIHNGIKVRPVDDTNTICGDGKCVFYGLHLECKEAPCLWDERNDGRSVYFIHVGAIMSEPDFTADRIINARQRQRMLDFEDNHDCRIPLIEGTFLPSDDCYERFDESGNAYYIISEGAFLFLQERKGFNWNEE